MRKRAQQHQTPVVRKTEEIGEPMGIVISRGDRDEPSPRFAAYVWCAAPEESEQDALVAVA